MSIFYEPFIPYSHIPTIMKLISYRFIRFVPFGDGEYSSLYELTMLKTCLFGLIKKQVIKEYNISMFGVIKEYEAHWDNLIEQKITL